MTRDEALAWVDGHAWQGVRPGLERITEVLELFDDPHRRYPVIHVAGTNGKTTVSRLASAILMGHGLRVGTFTSPHLRQLEERFLVDLELPSPEEFVGLVEEVRPLVDLYAARHGAGPTYFELTAVLAFVRFAAEVVDAAVVEVGLGGRLDATKVVRPEVAVVTSIGLDHTEHLGPDVATIAGEKVAIAEEGSVMVIGRLPVEAAEVATAKARDLGIPILVAGDGFSVSEAIPAVGGWQVDIDGVHGRYRDIFLPLHGRHQVDNLAVAVAACEAFFGRALSEEDLVAAVAGATSPGRLEVMSRRPLVLLDGAHNPDGMEAVVAAVREEFPGRRWVTVFGAMADKDLPAMVDQLALVADEVVVTAVDDPRATPAEDLAALVSSRSALTVTVEPDPTAALAVAKVRAGGDGAVLVLGSLYLVGALRSP